MDGKIDFPIEQCLFDLLCEKPFTPLLRQRAILDRVARGANNDKLDCIVSDPRCRGQSCTHGPRLHESERTAARADAQRAGGLRHISSQC